MSLLRPCMFWLALVLCLLAGTTVAAIAGAGDSLRVGVKPAPPFAFQSEQGDWRGIAVELWSGVAHDLDIAFEFHERDLVGLLSDVRDHNLDVGVGALTITPERESELDFTHPFFRTGLGIAVPARSGNPWLSVLRGFMSLKFLKVVGLLAFVLFVFGVLMWLLERRRNPSQFSDRPLAGIGAGFWWSAVTMTTVGYGDKAPVTFMGRVLGIVWMFAAIIVISSFTAAITTALTVTHLESTIQGPDDLPGALVGSLPASSSADYLRQRRIAFRSYAALADGMGDLAAGKLDALVYDAPLLQYLVARDFLGTLAVLDRVFEIQAYALVLPQGSALREPINRALLKRLQDPAWEDTLYRHLGTRPAL